MKLFKARLIATNEIIEVRFNDGWIRWTEPKAWLYREEFEILEEIPQEEDFKKEVTIEGWVARGANPHHLALYERKPDRLSDIWGFSHSLQLDPTYFPEVTWDTEPKRVKITITPIEE